MPRFTAPERNLIQGLVANLSIKRIPDSEIIKEVFNQTKKRKKQKRQKQKGRKRPQKNS